MKKLYKFIVSTLIFMALPVTIVLTLYVSISEPLLGLVLVVTGVLNTLLDNAKPVIKIKYFRDVKAIEPLACGDWVDLRAAEDVELKAGEYAAIPLGVAMQLPRGYEALVVPRSSTFKKYGVLMVNSMAVIDESYCGDGDEWSFLALATRDTKIAKDERIAQFRIIKHSPVSVLRTVKFLGNKNRGGVGSTGRY